MLAWRGRKCSWEMLTLWWQVYFDVNNILLLLLHVLPDQAQGSQRLHVFNSKSRHRRTLPLVQRSEQWLEACQVSYKTLTC
jgi:hypothetical protein